MKQLQTQRQHQHRLVRKFVSSSIVNLSRSNITSAEIELLEKGLSFVQTQEKIDKWQVKKDLEKLGQDIFLKMHYLDELTPAFSETLAFKVPSSWTLLIRDSNYNPGHNILRHFDVSPNFCVTTSKTNRDY